MSVNCVILIIAIWLEIEFQKKNYYSFSLTKRREDEKEREIHLLCNNTKKENDFKNSIEQF